MKSSPLDSSFSPCEFRKTVSFVKRRFSGPRRRIEPIALRGPGRFPWSGTKSLLCRLVFSNVSLFAVLALSATSGHLQAQTLDNVIFGNPGSESAHGLTAEWGPVTPAAIVTAGSGISPSDPSATGPSDTITGALGQTARRLLPRTPNPDVYGGEVIFTTGGRSGEAELLHAQNLGGSDPSAGIWLILDVNGLEVGSRHGGEESMSFGSKASAGMRTGLSIARCRCLFPRRWAAPA